MIPSPGTKISYVTWPKKKKNQQRERAQGPYWRHQAQASGESLPVESPVLNVFSNEL